MTVPVRIIVFAVVQLLACLYAVSRGGSPERWTAIMMAAAATLSAVVIYSFGIPLTSASPALFAVDLGLLFGLTWLAVRANRFWPLWIAALQLLAIAVHIAREIDPTTLPGVYNRALGKVAYPMMLLLIVGTRRHARRAGESRERDWSPVRW